MSRVLRTYEPSCLRLGWLRVLLDGKPDPVARIFAGHETWQQEAGLELPPHGNPQPSKHPEINGARVRWGLVSKVSSDPDQALTLEGQLFCALTALDSTNNPYIWVGPVRLAGLLLLLQVDGPLLTELFREPWPGTGLSTSELDVRFTTAISRIAADDPLGKRWPTLDSSDRTRKVVWPALEPLRELGLLVPRPPIGRLFGGYRLTREGTIVADALRGAGANDLLRAGLGEVWLQVEGIKPTRSATARELVGCIDRVPPGAWVSETELSLEALAWVAAAERYQNAPGVHTDPASARSALDGLHAANSELIAFSSRQDVRDVPNLVIRNRPALDAWLAAAPLAEAPPVAPPDQVQSPGSTSMPSGVKGVASANRGGLSDDEADRRAVRFLRMVHAITRPISAGHPEALSPASISQGLRELFTALSRMPTDRLTAIRDPMKHPLKDLVFPDGKKDSDKTKSIDPRPRRLLRPTVLRAIEDGERTTEAGLFRDLITTWCNLEEPPEQHVARRRWLEAACDRALRTQFETVQRWSSMVEVPSEVPERETIALLRAQLDRDRFIGAQLHSAAALALGLGSDRDGDVGLVQRQASVAQILTALDPATPPPPGVPNISESGGAEPRLPLRWTCDPGETESLKPIARRAAEGLGLEIEFVSAKPHDAELRFAQGYPPSGLSREGTFRRRREAQRRWGSVSGSVALAMVEDLRLPTSGTQPSVWREESESVHRSVLAPPALRRVDEAALQWSPADRVLHMWIALESVFGRPEAPRALERLSAVAAHLHIRARIQDELLSVLDGPLRRGLRADQRPSTGIEADAEKLILAHDIDEKPSIADLLDAHWRQLAPIRRSIRLDGMLPRPGARMVYGLCQDREVWRRLFAASESEGAGPARLALACLDACETVGDWEKHLAPLLRELWLDASALAARLYQQRNRVAHDGAGVDDDEQPPLERLALQGYAVFRPILLDYALATDETEASDAWERCLLSMRELTWTRPLTAVELADRRQRTLRSDEMVRWLGGP